MVDYTKGLTEAFKKDCIDYDAGLGSRLAPRTVINNHAEQMEEIKKQIPFVAGVMEKYGSALFEQAERTAGIILREEAQKQGIVLSENADELNINKLIRLARHGAMEAFNIKEGNHDASQNKVFVKGRERIDAIPEIKNHASTSWMCEKEFEAMKALEKAEKLPLSNNQTRTAAMQHGDLISTYDPDSIRKGLAQDMQHFAKQADGSYAQISHEEFLQRARGTHGEKIEMKTFSDEAGHFAVKLKDGTPVHLNANTGKQYLAERLAQLSVDKAYAGYQQASQQAMRTAMNAAVRQ